MPDYRFTTAFKKYLKAAHLPCCSLALAGTVGFIVLTFLSQPLFAATEAAQPQSGKSKIAQQSSAKVSTDELASFREHIRQAKEAERGPFSRIRWFCKDGQILPPKAYACVPHGGGVQHGEYTAAIKAIRAAGYPVANLYVEISPAQVLETEGDELLHFLVIERFLQQMDDGWLFRKARYYRGAMQAEDEVYHAESLLLDLSKRIGASTNDYLLVRDAARLFPRNALTQSRNAVLTEMRGLATETAQADPGFMSLRAKIHNQPAAEDAEAVRRYAKRNDAKAPMALYTRLAERIDAAFAPYPIAKKIAVLTKLASPEQQKNLSDSKERLEQAADVSQRLAALGDLAIQARAIATTQDEAANRLAALDISILLEQSSFTYGQELLRQSQTASRSTQLGWLGHIAKSLYGAGLISEIELNSIQQAVDELLGSDRTVGEYRNQLANLSRAANWAGQRLHRIYGQSLTKFVSIEPLAEQYIPDRLRASPLLFYARLLEGLSRDADRLAGVEHRLFGEPIAVGLRALNPGLSRGRLVTDFEQQTAGRDAIVLVPETIAELPVVAGILTESEGNALSHVQLLARNLGIPNVVIGNQHLATVREKAGREVVLAVSPGGLIELAEADARWANIFKQAAGRPNPGININVDKLELDKTALIGVEQLKSDDSGRVVGPKAAKLGALMQRYPGKVSAALAIPFGIYRELLELPMTTPNDPELGFSLDGPPLIEWLKGHYAELERLPVGSEAYNQYLESFLPKVRRHFEHIELPVSLRLKLYDAMLDYFGADGSYGVFVRSDTNVEDLPGFTGAGLNLTVPHVVGFEEILQAIKRVWASPFTTRAFNWRQGLVDQPEHVYASVLLHKSVSAEKSGVMVTADLDTGDTNYATVVVNEGVGGGVEGQSAENRVLNLSTGEAVLVNPANAAEKRVLLPEGGSAMVPTSGADVLLTENEIKQLFELARTVPERFPELLDANGKSVPADIEFGFINGELRLFQIRPFLVNDAALANNHLLQMDKQLDRHAGRKVDLSQPPAAASVQSKDLKQTQ